MPSRVESFVAQFACRQHFADVVRDVLAILNRGARGERRQHVHAVRRLRFVHPVDIFRRDENRHPQRIAAMP